MLCYCKQGKVSIVKCGKGVRLWGRLKLQQLTMTYEGVLEGVSEGPTKGYQRQEGAPGTAPLDRGGGGGRRTL